MNFIKSNKNILALFLFSVTLILFSFSQKNVFESIETKDLIIRSADGSVVHIGTSDGKPIIEMTTAKGKKKMQFIGGELPSISLFNDQQSPVVDVSITNEQIAQISLRDNKKQDRLCMQVGERSGIYLKNELDNIVGTLTTLEDGGCGLGLADMSGAAASILRGGKAPGLSFYRFSPDPVASFGVLERVPHFLVMGQEGEEGILIHGGVPTSMMLMDEKGALKVLISKHGIFKGNSENQTNKKPEKRKYFTYQKDRHLLFPDEQETR